MKIRLKKISKHICKHNLHILLFTTIHMPFVFNIYLGRLCDKNKIAIKYTKDFKTFLKAINYYMYVVKTTSKQILFN